MNPKDYSNYGLAQELLRLRTHAPELMAEAAKRLIAAPAPASKESLVFVGAGALQMVINALRRDAEEGKKSRGEMADSLLATAQAAPASEAVAK